MPSLKIWRLTSRLTSKNFSYPYVLFWNLKNVDGSKAKLVMKLQSWNFSSPIARLMLKSQTCRHILHKYANEDVSLGSWFIGLEVEHIDERNMCCGTPPGINSYIFCDRRREKKNPCFIYSFHSSDFPISRLRMEGTGRQRMHRLVRLELQRNLQIGREDQVRTWAMRWRRRGPLECFIVGTTLSPTREVNSIFD